MNWEKYRLPDGRFELFSAYEDYWNEPVSDSARDFVVAIDELRPIKSRQLAALILVLMRDKK